MVRRQNCGGCQGTDLDVVLDLGKTPLADRFPATASEPEVYYPLQLLACHGCGLAQLADVVPDDVLYGQDYAFYSSASPWLVTYHWQYAQWLLAQAPVQSRRLTVEIACNDGNLSEYLSAAGCRVVGVDPALGPVETARSKGLTVHEAFFTRATAAELRDTYGPAGVIVANNVLAHVTDLGDMLCAIAELLDPADGVAVVEFQYLPDLLAGNQWDHVYHEHRYYLTVSALRPHLATAGLSVVGVKRTPAQGGSVRLTMLRGQPAGSIPHLRHEHDVIAQLTALQPRVDYCASRIVEMLHERGGFAAGYGATAKSTTLLSYAGLGPTDLEYIVDTTPHKIGRITPGTHIPVVAPDDDLQPPDIYLLTAWNYLASVLRRERQFTDHGGKFLVPIPMPVLL